MKGAPARKHLVENRAKGKDVRTMIDRATLHLFGRHVADRSQYHAWISVDAASWYFSLRLAAVRLCEFRNAEVENLYATIFGDEDVVGLEIAMNDSFLVSRVERLRDLPCNGERLRKWNGNSSQPGGERLGSQGLPHQDLDKIAATLPDFCRSKSPKSFVQTNVL